MNENNKFMVGGNTIYLSEPVEIKAAALKPHILTTNDVWIQYTKGSRTQKIEKHQPILAKWLTERKADTLSHADGNSAVDYTQIALQAFENRHLWVPEVDASELMRSSDRVEQIFSKDCWDFREFKQVKALLTFGSILSLDEPDFVLDVPDVNYFSVGELKLPGNRKEIFKMLAVILNAVDLAIRNDVFWQQKVDGTC